MGQSKSVQLALVEPAPPLEAESVQEQAQLFLELAPLPECPVRPFRSEMTIDNALIFVANSYKQDSWVREAVTTHPITGEKIVSRVTVGKVNPNDRKGRGVLRQVHQKALYALYELWGRQGYRASRFWNPKEKTHYELGVIHCSRYELVTSLFPGDDSASAYNRANEILYEMRAVPIRVENVNSFTGWVEEQEFYLLDGTGLKRKIGDDDGQIRIMFSEFITDAFRSRHTQILLGQSYDALLNGKGRRCEIASLIYPQIEANLSAKPKYLSRLRDLAAERGFKVWEQPSRQRDQFKPAVAALQGRLLQEGRFTLKVELVLLNGEFFLSAERVPVTS